MDVVTSAIFSLSIGIGAVTGRVRYSRIAPAFYPFIYLTWIGFANEILSLTLMYNGYSNVTNYNVYSLIESLLITWQFYRWRLLGSRFFLFLVIVLPCCWLLEVMFMGWASFNSYYLIGYSLLVVMGSISMINGIVYRESTSLLKQPVFLICMGFVLYFTFSALTEIFWIFGLQRSRSFRLNMHEILSYINLFTNIIYSVAVLWMPMKRRSILPL